MNGMGRQPSTSTNDSVTHGREFIIDNLSASLAKSPNPIVAAIQSLERKTFPTSEALNIQTEVSKRNSHLTFARPLSPNENIIGYLIYINTSGGLRIHKVCVSEKFRRRRVATTLVECVCEEARKAGKNIDLWVDEKRVAAIQCYINCGFRQAGDTVVDYYGPGRNGLRMVWSCE